MSGPSRRQWASTAAGLIVGIVVLVFATAILTSAVSSSNTSDTVRSLSRQLEDANNQLEQLRAEYAAAQEQSSRERTKLTEQNRQLQHKLDVLVKFLRAHGLSVPDVVVRTRPEPAPKGTGPRGPKPRPTLHPGTPGPTATPMPTATPDPVTDLTCRVAPLLCP